MTEMVMICLFLTLFTYTSCMEVCTNALIPGAKGDQGETGDEGDQGKEGKAGPPGLPGLPGDPGSKGDVGQLGKTGMTGERGDKGLKGFNGPIGDKGSLGLTCDCGRYRREVGQLDVTISKLRKSVNFMKNVVLNLRETEEKFYLLVKESKTFKEASMSCKLRGGTLAMPKTSSSNLLMTEFINQAGMTGAYVGVVQNSSEHMNKTSSYTFADSSPLSDFSAWNAEQYQFSNISLNTISSCVELQSTGTWGHVECDTSMVFICEFNKSRRRRGRETFVSG